MELWEILWAFIYSEVFMVCQFAGHFMNPTVTNCWTSVAWDILLQLKILIEVSQFILEDFKEIYNLEIELEGFRFRISRMILKNWQTLLNLLENRMFLKEK